MLVAKGWSHHAGKRHAGHRVKYCTAADLVETLYRGLADNSVGRIIDTLLRNDLLILDEVGFAPLDDTGTQTAVPARRGRLRTPLAGDRLPLGVRPMGPVPTRAHHRRQHPGPAPAPRHRRRHQRRVLPHARRPPAPQGGLINPLRTASEWGPRPGQKRGQQVGP